MQALKNSLDRCYSIEGQILQISAAGCASIVRFDRYTSWCLLEVNCSYWKRVAVKGNSILW